MEIILNDFSSLFIKTKNDIEKDRKRYIDFFQLRKKFDSCNITYKNEVNKSSSSWDQFHGFQNILKQFDADASLVRYKLQRKFHREMIKAFCFQFFKNELEDNMNILIEKYRFKNIKPFVQIIAARRDGKSMAVNMAVIALLLTVPNIEIVMFSTGKRISTQNKNEILKLAYTLDPDFRQRIIKTTDEHLFIKGDSENDIRKLSSLPSRTEITIFINIYKKKKNYIFI